jgi:hypothetical protein
MIKIEDVLYAGGIVLLIVGIIAKIVGDKTYNYAIYSSIILILYMFFYMWATKK